jgi:hypothetical protein
LTFFQLFFNDWKENIELLLICASITGGSPICVAIHWTRIATLVDGWTISIIPRINGRAAGEERHGFGETAVIREWTQVWVTDSAGTTSV